MTGERILRTLILTMIGLTVFSVLRPSSPDPQEDSRVSETWFFINKAHQSADFDVVIIGDSRGLRGISPSVIAASLPTMRIFNFSFNSGGMNREMCAEAEALLCPASAVPTIIFAPTALSFMPFKTANFQFHEYRDKARDEVWLNTKYLALAEWFQPVLPSVFLRKFFSIQPKTKLTQVFHADGWIETDQEPHDDLSDLSLHRERLQGQVADPELIRDFMDQTAAWVQRGIRVFTVFPPADPPRIALEDSLLGFDRAAFKESFIKAGGVWLESEERDYTTYDGSHLVAASAREFSRTLGEALRGNLGH